MPRHLLFGIAVLGIAPGMLVCIRGILNIVAGSASENTFVSYLERNAAYTEHPPNLVILVACTLSAVVFLLLLHQSLYREELSEVYEYKEVSVLQIPTALDEIWGSRIVGVDISTYPTAEDQEPVLGVSIESRVATTLYIAESAVPTSRREETEATVDELLEKRGIQVASRRKVSQLIIRDIGVPADDVGQLLVTLMTDIFGLAEDAKIQLRITLVLNSAL